MRLIDADKLVKAIENENPGLSISGAVEKFARIAQVNMQSTVDAIPIEWVEKYIEDHTQYMVTPKYEDTHFTEPPIDYYTKLWPFQVAKMLERWEKENETD